MTKLLRFRLLSSSDRWTPGIGHKLGLLTIVAVLTAACGKFFPSATSLVAVSISPSNSTLTLSSKTQQFTATGTFGDSSSKDITSSVTWSSSSTNVATISSSGLATAGSTGSTTITASESGITGTTTLTVTNQANGLTISCTGCTGQGSGTFTAAAGSTLTFSATSSSNQTVSATWSSSNTTVANIGASTGVASNVTVGTTTITASANGATGSVTLTVQ